MRYLLSACVGQMSLSILPRKDAGPLSKDIVFLSSNEDMEEGWVQVTVGPQVGQKERRSMIASRRENLT